MKPFMFALLEISAVLANFSSVFTLNEISLIYLLSISIGAGSLVVSEDKNRRNPTTVILSSVKRVVIFPEGVA